MRLPDVKDVLFDEFPTDESVKYCIFTQPMLPQKDYSSFIGKVTFLCTESTAKAMCSNLLTPVQLFQVIDINRLATVKCQKPFKIYCIPTGNPSGSVMIFILVEDEGYLYTGKFTQCQNVLVSRATQLLKHKVDTIYVDNTMAAWTQPMLHLSAATLIKEIADDHPEYKKCLHMDVFGCEDLLVELARKKLKVQLSPVQRILLNQTGYGHLFEFDGKPDVTVYARLPKNRSCTKSQYKKFYENDKILHIKLIAMEHELYPYEEVVGLYLVPYTPHATAYVLHDLFEVIKPKYVHPLVFNYHSYDPMILISNDTLNDGCKIVEPENPLDILATIHAQRTTVQTFRETVESNLPSVVPQDESERSEDEEPSGQDEEPPVQIEHQLSQDSFLNPDAPVPGDSWFLDSCSDDDSITSQASEKNQSLSDIEDNNEAANQGNNEQVSVHTVQPIKIQDEVIVVDDSDDEVQENDHLISLIPHHSDDEDLHSENAPEIDSKQAIVRVMKEVQQTLKESNEQSKRNEINLVDANDNNNNGKKTALNIASPVTPQPKRLAAKRKALPVSRFKNRLGKVMYCSQSDSDSDNENVDIRGRARGLGKEGGESCAEKRTECRGKDRSDDRAEDHGEERIENRAGDHTGECAGNHIVEVHAGNSVDHHAVIPNVINEKSANAETILEQNNQLDKRVEGDDLEESYVLFYDSSDFSDCTVILDDYPDE